MSPRRSTRKHTHSEATRDTRHKLEPGSKDVILSLNDERYKEIMWRHYNILGKKQPGDKVREEGVGNQIFLSLKKSLGRGGSFFKKMSHGDLLFVVDDEGALQKITRDLKRRNESIHKWLRSDINNQLQDQPSYPPSEAISDFNPLSITQEHAWRDQLAPFPIEVETNYHLPQQTTHVHTHPVDTPAVDEKPPSSPKPNHVQSLPNSNCVHESLPKLNTVRSPNVKSIVEKLMTSHLGQRLPPLKTIPTAKSDQTPNQLIQILLYATHKLNELNGTHIKHCKVLRLYNLSELNRDIKSATIKAPSLAQLAESMETTPKSLKEWYTKYQNAVLRDFNFEKFGEDRIRDHYGVFYAVDERYQLSKCGERAMTEYFEEVGIRVVDEAGNAEERHIMNGTQGDSNIEATSDDLNQLYNIFAEVPGAEKDKWKVLDSDARNEASSSKKCRTRSIAGAKNEEFLLSDHKNPFLRNFQRNVARLDEFRSRCGENSSTVKLSSIVKRIKRGTKDRMLCMVVGCDKHAQTRCDGCCTSHFRILSTIAGKDKKKPPPTRAKSTKTLSVEQVPNNDDLERSRKSSSGTLEKRKFEDIQKNNSILSKLEAGSRIYVEWDGDNSLYKATVKKIFFDRDVPLAKIHYDGKKRHILDTIPLEMVKSFIEGEHQAAKQKQAKQEIQSLSKSQETEGPDDNTTNFPPLQKLYPGLVPLGMSEITQGCPELGTGWHVYVVARKGSLDGPRTDRYFISPTGKRFRSVPEVERYYWQNPIEFGGISSDMMKSMPQFENVHLGGEYQEVPKINQANLMTQPFGGSNLSTDCHSMATFPSACSPIYAQNGSNISGTASLIRISPIKTTGQSVENHQLSTKDHTGQAQGVIKDVLQEQNACSLGLKSGSQVPHPTSLASSSSTSLHCLKPPSGEVTSVKSGVQSPTKVASTNNVVLSGQCSTKNAARSNSAFTSFATKSHPPLNHFATKSHPQLNHFATKSHPPLNQFATKSHPPFHHQLYQTSPTLSNMDHFPGMRSASSGAQRKSTGDSACTTLTRDGAEHEGTGRRRPKRKLKPITRFEEEASPDSRRAANVVGQSKSVLCHCPECDKGDLSVQGIYAHYGRAHNGKLSWQNVTYSCPFCPPTRTVASQIFNSFHTVVAHVNASHPGCEVVGPHPSKLLFEQNSTPDLHQDVVPKSDRVLRERRAMVEASGYASKSDVHAESPEFVAEKLGPPSWTKMEYVQLLPDGKKEYPRDLGRVIDMVDEQCQTQTEVVELAREQRMKLCKIEAEVETRALSEERLSYQRGIRERARLADGERIEKHKFMDKAEQLMMRFQYENRNKRRNQEDVEVDKLCSRPIRFSSEKQRQNTRQGKACKDDQCQFCKKDKGYLHHLLLDSEMREFKMDAPATESPVFQQSTQVLDPGFRIINADYFTAAEATGDVKDDGKDAGGKKVNQSRRDASTAKRLKIEENKLFTLQNTKHSLEFIKYYNNGMMTNAWGETRKDSRGARKL